MAEPSLKRRCLQPERALDARARRLMEHAFLKKPIGKALGVYNDTMAQLDASGGGAPAERRQAGRRLGNNVRRAELRLETAAKAETQACADAAKNELQHDKLCAL